MGGAHLRMDAPLEVAVAPQHRRDDQVVLADAVGHRLRQRPRITDTVVYGDGSSDEGMLILDREIEDHVRASKAAVDHPERERRQRQRLLLDTVALGSGRLVSGREWHEPVTDADLFEEF